MKLSALVSACGIAGIGESDVDAHGYYDVDVVAISYDSRTVSPGSAFFALPGVHTDGHRYIQEALDRGAAAIFYQGGDHSGGASQISAAKQGCDHADGAGDYTAGTREGALAIGTPPAGIVATVPFIRCTESRLTLSQASAAFYGYPANELVIIGITGTDGKSSSVFFLHQLLEACGIPAGFISTVAIQTGVQSRSNDLRQSTPEAPEIHRLLRKMVDAGKRVAVIEATSHGLSEKTARLSSLRYDGGIFTNIDHEHLEFHGSFEQYLSDKANLFRRLRPINPRLLSAALSGLSGPPAASGQLGTGEHLQPGFVLPSQPLAVINHNDEQFAFLGQTARGSAASVISFSVLASGNGADGGASGGADGGDHAIVADGVKAEVDHSAFRLHVNGAEEGVVIRLPLAGMFNIDNVMGCVGILYYLFGISLETLARHIERLRPLQGRMLSLFHGQNFHVIVDYAHTPGSFRRIFPMLRRFCRKRLIAVFGSAGERDLEKRPIQGAIAASYADIIILTNEDPRLEDAMNIIDDIAAGVDGSAGGAKKSDCIIHKIPDRRAAIRQAIDIAHEGDMVIMLGKGHEGSIIHAHGKAAWNEEAEARAALEGRGYRRIR